MKILRNMVLGLMLFSIGASAAEFQLELLEGWNLVSVPIAPDDDSVLSVFQGNNLGPVWEWDAARQVYDTADTIQPGHGYWVLFLPDLTLRDQGRSVQLTLSGRAVRGIWRTLPSGWNMVGGIGYEPYAELPVPLATSSVQRDLTDVWGWTGEVYESLSVLAPGKGAWVFAAAGTDTRLSPNPEFEGGVMAYSPDVGQARVHWPEALDDRTTAEQMTYRVYAAVQTRTGDLIDDANLAVTETGVTRAAVDGLTPGETYDIAVVAEDGAGNRNYFNRTVLTVQVMEQANTLAAEPKDIVEQGAVIQEVSPDGTTVTVDGAAGVEVNDVIVFDNPHGQGLKRIVAVNFLRDGNTELVTEDASLADVIENGVLQSSLVVSDMDAVEPNGGRGVSGPGAAYVDPAGAFELTHTDAVPYRGVRKEVGDVPSTGAGTVSFDSGVSLGYDVGFEPSIDTDARFDGLSLEYCRIVATGEFTLDAAAGFELTGSLPDNPRQKLFGVSHMFFYAIGPCPACLPVWQEVGIDFYAEMNVTAAGALNMEAVYSAVKTVQVGVVYNEGTWSTVTSDGFEQSIEFNIEAQGTLLASVSVYPKLWTRFYSSLAADLYVKPSLGLDSAVRFIPEPIEMTKFDVDFTVDAYVTAGLMIFDAQLGDPWESPHWTMFDADLFSLPEIEFVQAPATIVLDDPAEFVVEITEGVNNPVSPGKIDWWIEQIAGSATQGRSTAQSRSTAPSVDLVHPQRGEATLTISPDRRTATVTATEQGTYRLWATAYGDGWGALDLEELGKRYVSTEFTVQQEADGDYLVIDLSAGPSASSYPVSYLDSPPARGWSDQHKTTKLVLRRIPAGTFTMGSPTDELGRWDGHEQQHQVTLTDDFYIGVFEVTQKQWERVMGNWPSYFNNTSVRDTRPVEEVSYDDIRGSSAGSGWPANNNVDSTSFLGKLRSKTGLVFDLPTEAQWEYACRAGTTTALNSGKNLTDEYDCPNMDEVGRYWYNGGSGYSSNCGLAYATAGAGTYQPNAWGLYDMHGNVWEWCLDWWATNHPSTAVIDPVGPGAGSYRVFRGGSWNCLARLCRSAGRDWYSPDYRGSNVGFRLMRAVP